jgi:peptidoglycan hydrolase CwlO-like protein
MKINRKIIISLLIVVFVTMNIFNFHAVKADTSADSLTNKISDINKQLKDATAELATQQSSLSRNQSQIAATKARIAKLMSDIADKERELNNLNDQAKLNKVMLGEYIRQMYYATQDQDPVIALATFQGNLSDMVSESDNMLSVKAKMLESLQIIDDAKIQTQQAKADLADQQADHKQLLQTQQVQQSAIVSDIQDTQATLKELNEKLNKLRSDLASLLGTNISTDDVKKAAGIASKATGVRKSFILAELTQESGLGRYTGGCTYKNTRVKPADATAFKGIMKELGYDINSKKISCAGSVGYGGAMGIAQFMPTTWLGYKSYISGATGHNPPDPWSVIDGIMGMAKKLANGGATSKKGEYNASMLYYCGTTKPANAKIKTACNNYAANVQRLANGYENN